MIHTLYSLKNCEYYFDKDQLFLNNNGVIVRGNRTLQRFGPNPIYLNPPSFGSEFWENVKQETKSKIIFELASSFFEKKSYEEQLNNYIND